MGEGVKTFIIFDWSTNVLKVLVFPFLLSMFITGHSDGCCYKSSLLIINIQVTWWITYSVLWACR